jgi:hypothetical protein
MIFAKEKRMRSYFTFCVLVPAASFCLAAAANEECERALQLARQQMTDELILDDIVVEEQVTTGFMDLTKIDFIFAFTLPAGYEENHARFEAERKQALQDLLPRLKKIRASFDYINPNMTFKERLHWLGHYYDEATDISDKNATLTEMMSLFTIRVEHVYMDLIASGTQSSELKSALYRALARLFKFDPSWRPALDQAMRTAGLPLNSRNK